MAPLTNLAAEYSVVKGRKAKSQWRWEPKHQATFEAVKKMVAEKVMLTYPDFSKPFNLWSNSSDYQLGGTLVQEDSDGKLRLLGFYTRQLNSAELNYNVSEKELLGIIEFMKAFQGMILGFELIVHTNHLNLLYHKLPNQRMCRWRLMMEEFHPTVVHCAGINNDSADALSRLPMKRKREDEIE